MKWVRKAISVLIAIIMAATMTLAIVTPVSAQDTTPPTDPTGVVSTSHTPPRWSNDNTVDIIWTDATDDDSGLDGYSILWDTNPTTIPDSFTYKVNDGQMDSEVAEVNMTKTNITWELVEVLVNPNHESLEFYGGGATPGWYHEARYEGKLRIYYVSETSIGMDDRHVDNGFEYWNVTLQTAFDKPELVLTPGVTVYLTATFTHGGTVTDGNLGVQFWYSGDGISMQPNKASHYFPWSPEFGGYSSVTYSFVVPQGGEGDTILIYAGWWNAAPCYVAWVYEAIAEEKENQDPVCSFTVTPSDPTSDDTLYIKNTSYAPGGDELAYRWYIDGDYVGDKEDGVWPKPDPGTHIITLEVEDEWGGSSQCSQTITVTPCFQVILEHIFNAGVRIGWAHIHAYWYALAAKPPLSTSEVDNIIEDLTGLRDHLEASGFPFENYNAPIDSLIAELRTGVRSVDIPEGIGSLMVDPGHLQAQLRGWSCKVC